MIDQEPTHYYQPGFLFIPFGIYKGPSDVVKPKARFRSRQAVEYVEGRDRSNRGRGEPASRSPMARHIEYDYLVIATGLDDPAGRDPRP